jgi:hypothetical protein
MKERVLFDDEFEKQLKEKSDQFKMYPSDRVWAAVHSSLHTKRKRFVAGMTLLIGGILILAASQLISPAKTTRPRLAIKTFSPSETPVSVDLHAFNPSPSKTSGSPLKLPGRISIGAPFINLNENDGDHSLLAAEGTVQPLTRVKSELAQVSNPARSANIVASTMSSGKTPALNLKDEEQQARQKLPVPADLTDLYPASDKSATPISHIRNDRFSWEIYVSPTLNTHHLNGVNYQNINSTIQRAPITVVRFANVNGFVDNTPAMGYDLGGNILYRLSRNLSVKAGLQFSFSQYFIKAYNSDQQHASAALSSYFGYIADSLTNYSLARSGNPKSGQHYQNRYYQLSMPVGLEWKVAGKGRLQLHVGATFQPSYLLNRNSYALSSDYNSYSKEPEIFRRWNLHAGAEAFLSYRVGKVRWELGPMVRYQILSTYKDSYPLKENLMNYGIRLGFSKTIR